MMALSIKPIRNAALMVGALSVAITSMSGCADMSDTQRGTAIGTGVGALGGFAAGQVAGGGRNARNAAVAGAAIGALGGYIWSRHMEEQKRVMEQSTAGTGVQVSQTADNQLKLDIPSDISFDVGQSSIKPNFRPILDRFAQTLVQNPNTTIQIIGHTDSTGNDQINNPLSVNRASSARDYLAQHGVAMQRVAVDGRGSHQPIADNNSDSGRARNRRVEIFVGEPQQQSGAQPGYQQQPYPQQGQNMPVSQPQYPQGQYPQNQYPQPPNQNTLRR